MLLWIFNFIKNPKVLIYGGAVIAVLIVGFVIYQAGKNSQKAKDLQASIEAIKERDKIDGKVNNLSDADLCAGLGGKWVSDHCE